MVSCLLKTLSGLLLLRVVMASTTTSDRMQCTSKEDNVQAAQANCMLSVRQGQTDFRHQKNIQPSLENLRVLLFVTTHLPPSHVEFLEKCWPGLISNSALLQHADVLVYTASEPPSDVLQVAFRGKQVRVEQYVNPGYQAGAMLAMEAGTSGRWFDGYDWVIRVNPDVLILNDDFLIKNMADHDVDAIFADCHDGNCTSHCTDAFVNSDFFAVRTSQLGPASFIQVGRDFDNAEHQVGAAFKRIMENGRDRWIPGTNMHGTCRIHGSKVPVLHSHTVLTQCPLLKGQPENRDIE